MSFNCDKCQFNGANGCTFTGCCPNKVSAPSYVAGTRDPETLPVVDSEPELSIAPVVETPSSFCAMCSYNNYGDGVGCVYPFGGCVVKQGICR